MRPTGLLTRLGSSCRVEVRAIWKIDAVLGQPGGQVLPRGCGQPAPGKPGIAGYFGVDIARKPEGEYLGVGTELGLPRDQSVQRRVENVDAERRDTVPGLGERPSRQRGNQLIVLGLGQVDVSDQALNWPGVRSGDLLGELVLVSPGSADVPQAQ